MPIDWLEPDQLAGSLPGRLALTILPGKRGASFRYPGRTYRRDVMEDLASLRAADVRRLVLLVEDAELRRWGDPDIVAHGVTAEVDVVRYPMPDGRAPASLDEMRAILASIGDARRTANAAVACMGGVGRSGTVAACALVEAGMTAAEAIATVRRVRHPTAVETAEQERFVRLYADQVGRRP